MQSFISQLQELAVLKTPIDELSQNYIAWNLAGILTRTLTEWKSVVTKLIVKEKIMRYIQNQTYRAVLRKRCFENMQQIYRRTPKPKCDFNKVACNFIEITLRLGCSPVNLLHIFRTPFPKNTPRWLLLKLNKHLISFVLVFHLINLLCETLHRI